MPATLDRCSRSVETTNSLMSGEIFHIQMQFLPANNFVILSVFSQSERRELCSAISDILNFFISPLLYHQSLLDYQYMYVDSRKWQ